MQDLKPQRVIESDSSWHFVSAQCDRADPVDHGKPSRFICQYAGRIRPITSIAGSAVTNRASWVSSGIFVRQAAVLLTALISLLTSEASTGDVDWGRLFVAVRHDPAASRRSRHA